MQNNWTWSVQAILNELHRLYLFIGGIGGCVSNNDNLKTRGHEFKREWGNMGEH